MVGRQICVMELKQHMDAIKKYGTTIHHRKSFKLT